MNNIYKVIWSKAKNCYVVASEIARSHTKSASGSEKIGGVTRRSLLASLMALSLLCGGLGVASATLEVVNQKGTDGTVTIYTQDEVDKALEAKGAADDVATNKADIATLKNAVGGVGSGLTKDVEDQKAAIAVNTEKIDTNKANITALQSELANKANKDEVTTALEGKANKADVNNALNNKADKTTVNRLVGHVGELETTVGNASKGLVKDVNELKAQGTTLNNALGDKADKSDLVAATNRIAVNEGEITALKNKTGQLSADGKELKDMTTVSGAKVSGDNVEAGALKVTGEISNGAGVTTTLAKINDSMKQTATNTTAINDLKTKTTTQQNAIDGLDAKTTKITYDAAKGTNVDGVTFNAGQVTGVTSINGIDIGDAQVDMKGKDLTGVGTINGTKIGSQEGGEYISQDGSIWGNLKTVDGQMKKNADNIETNKNAIATLDTKVGKIDDRTGGIKRNTEDTQTTIEEKVTVNNSGDVSGVKGLSAETITTGALNVTGKSDLKGDVTLGTPNGANTVTVNGTAHFNEAVNMDNGLTVDKGLTVTNGDTKLKDTTVEGKLKVTGTITTDKMIFGEAPNNYTEIDHGKVTSKNLVVNAAGQAISSSSTFNEKENEVGFANTITGDHSYHKQTADGIKGYVTDKDGNKTYTKVTATENSFQVQDKDGNKNHQVNTKDSSVTEITNKEGKTTKTEQTATDITNTAKDGTITNDAKDIVNNATTMKTTVTGKATESYGELETTVTGQATQNFNGGLNTTVKGAENHIVTGKQTNTVEGGQENIISGGQTNTITGGQINNITGDQTTTITGNKTETVTENVTEDYKKDLTTTVGGNETHEVKGTKTETVEGKVTENFKNGQETNVTGDQVIKVSGTQTTTATDINRNASSGMIDTIDNDYGTNTETKVAGKTTTDVSIKGTGEEGKYIRGANESRDYLIKGTLKNSETKTVEKTSTEITDGNGNTSSTIQDVKNLAGSLTNGTEIGVSGIHANDNGSVSIDSIVTGGGTSSVINQKKGSIQSTVVDGTNSTVILQDKDNVTIASSKGMVAIGGKDIVNNAQETITNTAGTKITDKAGDSTVTTENGKGTTFAKTGSTAFSTGTVAPTDTNIAGNLIKTGRVEANELGVSDVDGTNTADLSVKAGEGVKASAGNGTTTGSLDVKADEVKTEVKDDSTGKHTNTSQTADGIKGYATDKDGNKTYTKVTATENSFQVQDKNGENTNHQVNTKDKSENTITNGTKTNTVTSTAGGTTFNNSKANTVFEGGTYTDTTITGNTITTGKVTMDYAKVMKDLGVTGNAKVGKNLEVTGTSTLNGEVIMGSNAKVGGTLDVTKRATFHDDVDITGNVTATSYKVGDKTYIDKNGINANNQKITNVADGSISEGSKDAVNGGQLYGMKMDLEHKVDKVGANAAAMANLHPMEFDPDSKWNIAAAMGNYGSETATAIGAFYRPNEDVMVNFSTAFGTGENMVGGGVSVRLGKGSNKLSREESNALKDQVDDLTARMDALLSVLNPNMSKDFPDVPENHWAYEAVSRLAGNDIVQGYPDGEFHGDRTMTRYEMAEIIYNALSRGAEAERELVEEFKPELQAMAASEKATAERAEG